MLEKVKAEIERLMHQASDMNQSGLLTKEQEVCIISQMSRLLSFVESLKKEQEKELNTIKNEWWNKGYLKGREQAHIPAKELGLPSSLDKNTPKIKGWVVRDKSGTLFLHKRKPKRMRSYWDSEDEFEINDSIMLENTFRFATYHEPEVMPDLKWEDEPIEVELAVNRV